MTGPIKLNIGAGRILVISGVSGGGKSTIRRMLRERCPDIYASVSFTTRRPRPGEIQGVDYDFATFEIFQRLEQAGELLEWTEYAGCYNGTVRRPVEQALRDGRPVLFVYDIGFTEKLVRAIPATRAVFLDAPADKIRARLLKRGGLDQEKIDERVRLAEQERDWALAHPELLHYVGDMPLWEAYDEVENAFFGREH